MVDQSKAACSRNEGSTGFINTMTLKSHRSFIWKKIKKICSNEVWRPLFALDEDSRVFARSSMRRCLREVVEVWCVHHILPSSKYNLRPFVSHILHILRSFLPHSVLWCFVYPELAVLTTNPKPQPHRRPLLHASTSPPNPGPATSSASATVPTDHFYPPDQLALHGHVRRTRGLAESPPDPRSSPTPALETLRELAGWLRRRQGRDGVGVVVSRRVDGPVYEGSACAGCCRGFGSFRAGETVR